MQPSHLLTSFTLLTITFLLGGCIIHQEQTLTKKVPSYALSAEGTALAAILAKPLAEHTNMAGVVLLGIGSDAFDARLSLVNAAERSLDVQYYLLEEDTTGRLFTGALLNAADRGVRVRILLDDFKTARRDQNLALLNSHPNIEIRLFNAFILRNWRGLNFLANFSRMNRRMHNKSLTSDNSLSIVGGRNIGDVYFSADKSVEFSDLDVLLLGQIVEEVSRQFDVYWNCDAALPVPIIPRNDKTQLEYLALSQSLAEHHIQIKNSEYGQRVKASNIVERLNTQSLPISWGKAWLYFDPPEKVSSGHGIQNDYLYHQIQKQFEEAREEILIISPYFVPGKQGAKFLLDMANKGKDITIITNSLAATDVVPVHSGYAKYRKPLLNNHIKLYEVKAMTEIKTEHEHGLSAIRRSLHAKTFVIDKRYIFVGSFNFDLRSALLNTEMGVLIDSVELATTLYNGIDRMIPESAYQVSIVDDGTALRWTDKQQQVSYSNEPDASVWQRLLVAFCSLFPIEALL